MVPGVLLDLLLPLAPVDPVLEIRRAQQIGKVILLHSARLFIFLDLSSKIHDLTGLPEFPIKPGTPGRPLLPYWKKNEKY